MSKDNTANCLQCGAVVEADPYSMEGDIIFCLHCDTELKITNSYPLKVKTLKKANKFADDYMGHIEDKDENDIHPDYNNNY